MTNCQFGAQVTERSGEDASIRSQKPSRPSLEIGLFLGLSALSFIGSLCLIFMLARSSSDEELGTGPGFVVGSLVLSCGAPILSFFVLALKTRRWERFLIQSFAWGLLSVALIVLFFVVVVFG